MHSTENKLGNWMTVTEMALIPNHIADDNGDCWIDGFQWKTADCWREDGKCIMVCMGKQDGFIAPSSKPAYVINVI